MLCSGMIKAFAKNFARTSAGRFKFVHYVGNIPYCRISYRRSFDHARINTIGRGNNWADNTGHDESRINRAAPRKKSSIRVMPGFRRPWR